jgi:hypothetical protein
MDAASTDVSDAGLRLGSECAGRRGCTSAQGFLRHRPDPLRRLQQDAAGRQPVHRSISGAPVILELLRSRQRERAVTDFHWHSLPPCRRRGCRRWSQDRKTCSQPVPSPSALTAHSNSASRQEPAAGGRRGRHWAESRLAPLFRPASDKPPTAGAEELLLSRRMNTQGELRSPPVSLALDVRAGTAARLSRWLNSARMLMSGDVLVWR